MGASGMWRGMTSSFRYRSGELHPAGHSVYGHITVIPAKAGTQARNLWALPPSKHTPPSFQRKLETTLLLAGTAVRRKNQNGFQLLLE